MPYVLESFLFPVIFRLPHRVLFLRPFNDDAGMDFPTMRASVYRYISTLFHRTNIRILTMTTCYRNVVAHNKVRSPVIGSIFSE